MERYNSRRLAFLLGFASLLVVAAAVLFFCAADTSEALLLSEPADPAATVEEFFESVCAGDYTAAAAFCLGGLPEEAPPAEGDAAALYAALRSHRSWEFSGASFVRGGRAYYEVAFTYPDAAALTEGLPEAVESALAVRVDEAGHSSDVYDENGAYREDVVLEVWNGVLSRRLEQAGDYTVTVTLPVVLLLDGHNWRIQCSDELLTALRGGL